MLQTCLKHLLNTLPTFMNIFTSLAGIEKMEVKLNSFKVNDALESLNSLNTAFFYKISQEIKLMVYQVHLLIQSLNLSLPN